MAYCNAKDGEYSCTLDKDHYGPSHVDNDGHNHSWFDFDLPEPPAPEEPLEIPAPLEGEM